MKIFILTLIILSGILLTTCSGEDAESIISPNVVSSDSLISYDTIEIEEISTNDNFTLPIMIDGPDNDLYIEIEPTPSELKNPIIDIIPYDYPGDGIDDSINEDMMAIARDNFRFYGALSEYTGQINFYYDRQKKYLMTSFSLIDGKPDGICTLRNPEDEIYIERIYKNGKLIDSPTEPFGAKWKFNQAKSSLTIEDVSNAFDVSNIVNIMPSMVYGGEQNYLDFIIEKASFLNPFTINDKIFTGTLNGYQHPVSFDKTPLFELNFKDGLLHGEIKIYTWWGELQLHEKFVQGNLTQQIYVMDESEMDGVAKPIIYLYPEKTTNITVKLDFQGNLTHTYPKYNKEGWKVKANPDGTLFDQNNKEYYALYWEGMETQTLNIPNGNVIKGSQTIEFLEKSLPLMGLSAKETNEFIIYWLPQLENNPYNLIHFSTKEYEAIAKLNITPKPETIIRVMMVFEPLNYPKEIETQNLSLLKQQRKGFTVVEWGGRRIKNVKL